MSTPEKIAFFVRHTSGVICTPLTGERLDDLEIPLMVRDNTEAQRTDEFSSLQLPAEHVVVGRGIMLPAAPPSASRGG